jgi:hypothetical protein
MGFFWWFNVILWDFSGGLMGFNGIFWWFNGI